MTVSTPCIKIQAHSQYVPDQSSPEQRRFVFSYKITIRNLSQQNIQLISRRWLITDGNGKQLTVAGDGVVGEQPFILGNDEYTYTSGTAIETPVGVMQGHYVMKDDKDNEFIVAIDPFSLSTPNSLN